MRKRKCVAMLLAGGRGSRLHDLTDNIAKPAVPFGGKFRIIDFTLSNCRNSGIDTVGVLTQYNPHMLHNYIGSGGTWDLARKDGGLSILPPYQCNQGERWYEGTAHAIYQNLHFIEQYNPEHVLVISGDHIYKMNYTKMLEQHIRTDADVTISVMEVPWKEANRFGIIETDENQRILEFEEKPKKPTSNLASMGIYIFKTKVLKHYLELEEKNELSSKDFGKNIIPTMLFHQSKAFAYKFKGYWKDVGTIRSFWEANMDLLTKETNIFLHHKEWEVYTVEQVHPPQYLDSNSHIKQSIISDGCEVYGEVEHSVLFNGVIVGEGSIIKNSVILPGTVIGDNVIIENAVVCEGMHIPNNKAFTCVDEEEVTLIGEKTVEAAIRSLSKVL